jgi:glyceraldehyde 3-phosphate dehydrogenase
VLPDFDGKILTSALNVPVQEGCLLDLTLVFADENVTIENVNEVMRVAAGNNPGVIAVAEDPIVSSDVIGNASSLLFDAKGTIKAGRNTIKTLSWYESLGHAARLLDVVRLYDRLDQQEVAA